MGFEILLALVFFLIVMGFAVAIILLPIVALNRTRRLPELLSRIASLEKEVRRLRTGDIAPAPMAEKPTVEVKAVPHTIEDVSEEPLTVLPAPKASPAAAAINLEAWIGGRAFGWIAVVLLIFAAAFFLSYVFEHGIIGPLGRVTVCLLIGLGLAAGGLRCHRKGWRVFGQFLTSGGMVLLYLSTFASFGYYNLLPQEHAGVFLVAIIVETALLAILYDSPAIAIMAVIGGLLAPMLLRTDRDQYVSLFIYLLVLNAGFLLLTLIRAWPAIATTALVGTHFIFWAWFSENYHPEKHEAALVFQAVLFVLFLGRAILDHGWRRRLASNEDLARLTINAFLFALALFVLVDPYFGSWFGKPEVYAAWRGPIALGLAVTYTLLAWWLVATRPYDPRQQVVAVAIAMAMIATAFAWQAHAAWIALGWAIQGLALWWFGLRIRANPLRWMGAAFLGLAACRLVLIDTLHAHREPFVPLLNTYCLPALAVALSFVAAALASRRYASGGGDFDLLATRLLGLGGVVLLWLVLSFETYQYFEAQSVELIRAESATWRSFQDPNRDRTMAQLFEQQQHFERSARMALSVLWAVYAIAMLTIGFRLASRPLRWFALGLFGLTLIKVALIDTAELSGLYRVAVFLALSVMMALAAWGYQKVSRVLLPESKGASR